MVDSEDADGAPAGASFFRGLPDPAVGYALDPAPTVRAVNPAFAAAFGADPDGSVGRPLSAALVGDPDGPTAADLADRIAGGEAVDAVVDSDVGGETRHFRCRSFAVGDAAAADGYVVYADVTDRERERRDRARRADRAEAFLKVVTHDLRNPMEVARLRTRAAREEGDEVHFEKALWAVERMDEIIDSARSMVLENERLTTEPVDLAAVAREAWEAVETGDATLVADDLGGVRADPGYLRRLFENLFRNSVEHGSTGSR
ncbi:MAG: PAS domain-containing protein, partial [Haloferacaceae archaeon]